MNIVVIGKKNHLNWDTHVKNAFVSLGHEVKHIQINNRPFWLQFLRGTLKGILGKKKGNKISDSLFIREIKKQLNLFEPNLIFFTSACFIPSVFYKLSIEINSKPKIFAWEGDGSTSSITNIYIKDFVDVFFDSQSEYVKKNLFKFANIYHLPFAVDPLVYKYSVQKRENKLYFCGAFTEERNSIFSSLINYNIVLKGWNWNKLSKKSDKFHIEEKTVNIKTLIADYNRYMAVLNIHQSENAHFNSDLNMRAFEVPACGALLINDYRTGIEKYFEPEKEICVYRNIDELKEILDRLKKSPKDFDSIRENGYKKVIEKHTYKHRMIKVIDIYNNLEKENS